MRGFLTVLFVCVIALSLTTAAVAEEKCCGSCKLFNGECLEGWDYFLVDPDVKMEDVWSVKDGLLVCKGEPMGYCCTKKEFENFKLIVEWRWAPGKKPGNSGVLLRITGKPMALPRKLSSRNCSPTP